MVEIVRLTLTFLSGFLLGMSLLGLWIEWRMHRAGQAIDVGALRALTPSRSRSSVILPAPLVHGAAPRWLN